MLVPSTRLSNVAVKWVVYSANEDIILQFVTGSTEHMLVATGDTTVTYPVVVVNVEGIKCRALLDTGAGSSYASSALLERL